jgi:RND family efflux transporter MFP subunit
MQAPRFGAAALALVNGLIRLLGLRQAVLCWRVGARAEVVAISHLERFEKTSRLVQAMQEAAAEVLSVDRVLSVSQDAVSDALQVLPPAHLELLRLLDGAQGLTGVPMRDASGQTQAVVLCATERGPIEAETLNQLLLMLEMVLPRLTDARNRQLNPFKRFRLYALDKLSILFGPKRPWIKFWAVVCSISVAVLLFGQMPYRIEASAQLTTDSVRVITPQMDGRLQDVLVDVGDLVKQGQTLSSLDTSDLKQQELEIGSELQRFQAEADKARAARALADLQVAMFRGAQAAARLQRVRYLLEQAQLRAPFDGVVVEGERRKLLGASVRRGDAVFRVAQVQDLYLVLQVPERDVRSIGIDSQGEFVLLSQPGEPIAFKVSNFVPMAQVKGEEGNQFLLKAVVQGQAQPWWRPGMTGLAKIDVGYRNIGWILLHRTYDTLRLWFWL